MQRVALVVVCVACVCAVALISQGVSGPSHFAFPALWGSPLTSTPSHAACPAQTPLAGDLITHLANKTFLHTVHGVHLALADPAFARLVKEAANAQGQIMITTFHGEGFRPWIRNLLFHAHANGVGGNLLIVGMSWSDCSWLLSSLLRVWCYVDSSPYSGALNRTVHGDISKIPKGPAVVLKFYYIYQVLLLGYTCLFTDGDVVFVGNPFSLYDPRYELTGLSDYLTPVSHKVAQPLHECSLYKQTPCQSTGLMFYTPTITTMMFLAEFLLELLNNPGKWEQESFQYHVIRYLMGSASGYWFDGVWFPVSRPGLRYRLLDDELACNCYIMEHMQAKHGWKYVVDKVKVIHVGFINYKTQAYDKLGLWLPLPLDEIAHYNFSNSSYRHTYEHYGDSNTYTCA